MFPDLEEGGLATYRSSLVQNKHLAILAKVNYLAFWVLFSIFDDITLQKLGLDEFMLYAHGPDLCHDADLRHAMANAFEAVMGAVFLDSGIEQADQFVSSFLWLVFNILLLISNNPFPQMFAIASVSVGRIDCL